MHELVQVDHTTSLGCQLTSFNSFAKVHTEGTAMPKEYKVRFFDKSGKVVNGKFFIYLINWIPINNYFCSDEQQIQELKSRCIQEKKTHFFFEPEIIVTEYENLGTEDISRTEENHPTEDNEYHENEGHLEEPENQLDNVEIIEDQFMRPGPSNVSMKTGTGKKVLTSRNKKLPFLKKTKILESSNFNLYIERTDFKTYNPVT